MGSNGACEQKSPYCDQEKVMRADERSEQHDGKCRPAPLELSTKWPQTLLSMGPDGLRRVMDSVRVGENRELLLA